MRLLKIFEWLWAFVAVVAATMAILRATRGENWGSYLYISLFTATLATFMYFFKKKNRLYMERYHKEKAARQKERAKGNNAEKTTNA